MNDRYLAPGTVVRYDGLSVEDSGPEYGIVVHCWNSDEISAYDCYVAFFGPVRPVGAPTERPYILRYAVTSLTVIE
jgi:hypothetical protein